MAAQQNVSLLTSSLYNVIINNASANVQFTAASSTIDNDLTIEAGICTVDTDSNALVIANNISITGIFGHSTWTGSITVGGDFSGIGTYLHGNQVVTWNGIQNDAIQGNFTFYDIVVDKVSNTLYIGSTRTVTVEHTLTINETNEFIVYGNTGNSTLIMGTADSSGNIANAGIFDAHMNAGTENSYIEAANVAHYANLEGTGTYDWDYGTTNGEVHLKWLNMKGTDASAKTTGGGNVIIILDGPIAFNEDFTVHASDTFDRNSQAITIFKDYTEEGTIQNAGEVVCNNDANVKILLDVIGTNLTIDGTGDIYFDGTETFSGDVTWLTSTADFLPYDATSILNVTGGIITPASTYFGADASGNMGDGNAVTGWTAEMTWGWLETAGITTLSTGNTEVNSATGTDALNITAGTVDDNNGTVTFTNNAQQDVSLLLSPLHDIIVNNAGADVRFTATTNLIDNITVTTGLCRCEDDTVSITLVDDLTNEDTFGHATWSGSIIIGGNFVNNGSFLHSTTQQLTLTGNYSQNSAGNTNTLSTTTTIDGTITLDDGTLVDLRISATQVVTINGGEFQYGVTRTEYLYSYIKTGGTVVINTGVILTSRTCSYDGAVIENNTTGPAYYVDTIEIGGAWNMIFFTDQDTVIKVYG